jgi:uncharacterized protein YdcH (DUF465 family)
MSTEHPLIAEFPELRNKIHEMKVSDHHFAKLFTEYHEVDHELHRIEQEIETPSDTYTEELKKKRLNLKDQLYVMLTK